MASSELFPNSEIFALRIIKLYKYLINDRKEYILSKQVLRSGTSIGANLAESVFAQSDADFITKYRIALKEANETAYWLRLLHKSDYINDKEFDSIIKDCNSLIKMLVSALKKLNTKTPN